MTAASDHDTLAYLSKEEGMALCGDKSGEMINGTELNERRATLRTKWCARNLVELYMFHSLNSLECVRYHFQAIFDPLLSSVSPLPMKVQPLAS